jgi:hypothetical protein
MTKTELLELIRNGETSGVEFKRDAPPRQCTSTASPRVRPGGVLARVASSRDVAQEAVRVFAG